MNKPMERYTEREDLIADKSRFVLDYATTVGRAHRATSPRIRASAHMSAAESAARLADISRQLAEIRAAYVKKVYEKTMLWRYGKKWVATHQDEIKFNGASAASKDPLFKEYAAANEMYNRWAIMHAQIASAINDVHNF